MRNGLRRWQTKNQQEAKKLDKPSAASEKNKIQVGIPTKTVSLAAIVGFLAAYTQFLGYSYFTAKMEAVGFAGVDIDLTAQQSLDQALEAFSMVISKLSDADFYTQILPSFSGAMFVGFMTPFAIYVTKKVKDYSAKEGGESPVFRKIIIFIDNKLSNIWFASLASIPSAIIVSLFGAIVIAFIFYLLLVFWVFAILGSTVGQISGKSLVDDDVCNSFGWSDVKFSSIKGCSTIKLDNGYILKGLPLYRIDQTTYFLANDGAYEINGKGSVKTFTPFHKRPKEVIDTGKTVKDEH